METDKFALKFDDKNTFLEKIIYEYHSFGCENIIVVINSRIKQILQEINFQTFENVQFAINLRPELGRFSSIKKGFELNTFGYSFISNIDNPFIDQTLLAQIFKNRNAGDFIVPSFKGRGGHPILLNSKIKQKIKSEKQNDLNLRIFLSNFKKFKLEQNNEKVLLNINTKEIYYDTFKKYNFH